MLNLHITREELEDCAEKLRIDLDAPNSPYRRLLNAGVLQELNDVTSDPMKQAVGIRNDRILEYLLYEHLRVLPKNAERVRDALKQAETYHPLWGALHILLTEDWDDALVLALARPCESSFSPDPEVRAFISSLCSYNNAEHSDRVSKVIGRMLSSSSRAMGPLAVSAAYRVRDVGLLVRSLQSQDSVTQATAVQYSYLMWRENRELGSQILFQLSASIRDAPNGRVIQAFVHLAMAIGIKQFRNQEVLDELVRQSRITITGLLYPQLDSSGLNALRKLKRQVQSLFMRGMLGLATSSAAGPITKSTTMFMKQALGDLDAGGLGGPSDWDYFLRRASDQQREEYRELLRFVRPENNDLETLDASIRKLASNRDILFFLFAGEALMMQGHHQRKPTLEMLSKIYADSKDNNSLKWLIAAASDVISGAIWVDMGSHELQGVNIEETAREQIEYHSKLIHRYVNDTHGAFTVASRRTSVFDVPIYRTALLEAEVFKKQSIVSEIVAEVSAFESAKLLVKVCTTLQDLIQSGYLDAVREPLLSLLAYHGKDSGEVHRAVVTTLAFLRTIDPEEADRIIYSIGDKNERNRVNGQLQLLPPDEIMMAAHAYLRGSSEMIQYILLKYPRLREEIIRLAEKFTRAKTVDTFLRELARTMLDLLSNSPAS